MGSFAIVKGNSTTCANTKLALLSSDPLTKKAGLKQSAISRFENLGKSPTLKFLFKLLKALDGDIKIVLKDEEMIKSYKRGNSV